MVFDEIWMQASRYSDGTTVEALGLATKIIRKELLGEVALTKDQETVLAEVKATAARMSDGYDHYAPRCTCKDSPQTRKGDFMIVCPKCRGVRKATAMAETDYSGHEIEITPPQEFKSELKFSVDFNEFKGVIYRPDPEGDPE